MIYELETLSELDKIRIAMNPKTNPDILHILAQDKNELIRAVVAKHPNLLLKTQELLSKDKSDDVRIHLGYNIKVNRQILHVLAHDYDGYIRSVTAAHYNISPQDIKTLSQDEEKSVQKECFNNPTYHRLFVMLKEQQKRREKEYEEEQKHLREIEERERTRS